MSITEGCRAGDVPETTTKSQGFKALNMTSEELIKEIKIRVDRDQIQDGYVKAYVKKYFKYID